MFDAGSLIFNIRTAGAAVFRQELDQADTSVKKLGSSTKDTAKSTEDLGNKQETAKQKAARLAKEQAEAARKARELADAQRQVGTVLAGVGAAIIAIGVLSVNAAIQWESSWAGVTKTVDGTVEELTEVKDGLRGLTSELPASHQEIAAVAEAAGQLGVQTKNVVGFTKTMIDLGETTNLSANEAATSLARFMNVMGTSQDRVSNLGSSVVELGNNYATTEAEIVSMAQRLAGAGKQVGLTEGEVLGLATALSSVGIEAEAGGSAVSKVIIDIAASVDKGGERVEQFAKIAGVGADTFVKKWKTDPGAALALFVKGLANAETQGESTLGMLESLGITETRMRDALLRSASASDQFTRAMKTGNEAFEENNALTLEAAKRYDTVESKLQITRNNVMDTAIAFGEVFLPAVVGVSDAVSGVAQGLGDLPEPAQAAIAVVGTAGAAIVLLTGVMLLAVPKIAEFRLAMQTLNTTMSRTAIAGGVVGLALTATIAVLSAMAGANADAEARAQGLAETFDKQTGAITRNTRAYVADLLQKEGSIKAAKELGISAADLVDAYLQEEDAVDRVNKKLEEARDPNSRYRKTLEATGGSLVDMGSNITYVMKVLRDGEPATEDGARRFKELAEATDTAGGKADDAADSYGGLGGEVGEVISAVAELAKELDELNGKNLDSREAARQLEQAYDDFDAVLKENGRTLDITTQAGRDNQAALDDIAKAALDSGQAIIDAGGGYKEYQASLETSRAALLDRINDLGISGQAAEDLANQILKIPSATEWKMRADTADAEERLRRINNLMKGIGATSTLHISTAPGRGGMTLADGGKVIAFANGGLHENHQAQFAAAGTVRVWAEPETGGEYYIPASPSKRARSTRILADAADEFGYSLMPKGAQSFVDGGFSGRRIGTGFDPTINITVNALPGMSEEDLARRIGNVMRGEMTDLAHEVKYGRAR